MYLVGLHIYYKMIHGPYNIEFISFLSHLNQWSLHVPSAVMSALWHLMSAITGLSYAALI